MIVQLPDKIQGKNLELLWIGTEDDTKETENVFIS